MFLLCIKIEEETYSFHISVDVRKSKTHVLVNIYIIDIH